MTVAPQANPTWRAQLWRGTPVPDCWLSRWLCALCRPALPLSIAACPAPGPGPPPAPPSFLRSSGLPVLFPPRPNLACTSRFAGPLQGSQSTASSSFQQIPLLIGPQGLELSTVWC